jgi:Protein of unknown function (DUF2905)
LQALPKILVTLGAALLLLGVLLRVWGGRFGWLGHLPGDIRIGNSVYIPITTCIVVSVALTIVINLIVRIFWR